MAKIRLYLDQRKPCKDGRCPVKVSVYTNAHGVANRYIVTTGVFVNPKYWDAVKCQDKRSASNNAILGACLDKVRDFIADCIKNGSRVNSERLRAVLEGRDASEDDSQLVLPYFRSHAATKRAERTREVYLATAIKIEEFAGSELRWTDINHKWLTDWDRWMERTMPSANSRGIHLRNLRHVVNEAIDDELLTSYPFRRFSIKKQETDKLALSVGQLRQMMDADMPSGEGYRDVFLLMFYLQGINIGDLCRLPLNSYDGHRLRYRRSKTGRLFSIKVEPEAAALIDKYHGKNGVYLLDILERWKTVGSFRSKIDKRLKVLFPDFSHMSTNCARHTYATLLGEIGVPIEVISQAMGHSIGSSVTAIYIKQDQRKVDDANRRLFDYIKNAPPSQAER